MAWWTEEEKDFIERLAGTMSFAELYKRYQKEAKRRKWTVRCLNSVRCCAYRLNGSSSTQIDGFPLYQLARILGVNPNTIYRMERDGLKVYRYGYRTSIFLKDLNKFVSVHPRIFGNCNAEGLAFVLTPENLELVQNTFPSYQGRKLPVCRTDTGERFESIRQAARKTFFSTQAIADSIYQNKPTLGVQWQRIG